MIDLKRRKFIRNVGFVGVSTLFCSSLIAQNTLSHFSDLENDENSILSKFSKSTVLSTFLLDQNLSDCYKNAVLSWEKNGYRANGDFCYSSSDGLLKMFPLHLYTNNTGKLDTVLICIGKNSHGEWKSLRSLSGFDLEAITTAMNDLKKYQNEVNLSHYFFPSPSQQLNPYGFETKKGSVELQTLLAPEQTSTKILVKEGNIIVYQKEIISKHTLIFNSVFV